MTESALERVRALAERWTALEGNSLEADVSRCLGEALLKCTFDDRFTPQSRLAEVTRMAESWLTPGSSLFDPAAGQCVLDAIKGDSPASPVITAEEGIKCGSVVVVDEDDALPCGAMSRYLVERSDGDQSYGENGGSAEACEEHLAETVTGMVDGDTGIRAIVTIRWDKPVPLCACGHPVNAHDDGIGICDDCYCHAYRAEGGLTGACS